MNFYIFKYHEVTNQPDKTGFINKGAYPYKHSELDFATHLKIILKRFKKTSHIYETSINNNKLIMTFDDGGVSSMHIAKELEEMNCRGYFFIVTSLINKNNFLSKSQIYDLSNRGHIIGSHSHTHPTLFKDLSFKEKLYEWKESRKILEDIIYKKVLIASLPGGDIDDQTIEAAFLSGIRHLFTSEPGLKTWQKYGVKCYPAFCPKKILLKKT